MSAVWPTAIHAREPDRRAEESTTTTSSDRPSTALVDIDVQVGVVADTHQRDAVITDIGALVERARG